MTHACSPDVTGAGIRGHTASLKWRPGVGSNNWSLSAGRAETTRQALLRSGVAEARFRRIEGVADRTALRTGMKATASYLVPKNFNPALGYDMMEIVVTP